MRGLLLLLVALAGCDNVFRLIRVEPQPADALTVDGNVDASLDAALACPVGFIAAGDYDNDALPNNADPCPQHSTAQTDSDNDGIGDMCDPHPSLGSDCLLFMDTFDTLDCWHAYEPWTGCVAPADPSKPCSATTGGTLDLQASFPMDTAQLHGTIYSVLNGGPSLRFLMNDSQPGAGITGDTCGLTNASGFTATAIDVYANNVSVMKNFTINSPMQLASGTPYDMAIVWGLNGGGPSYECDTITVSGTVAFSSFRMNTQVVPAGAKFVIRTDGTVFRPRAFLAYGFGTQCNKGQ